MSKIIIEDSNIPEITIVKGNKDYKQVNEDIVRPIEKIP